MKAVTRETYKIFWRHARVYRGMLAVMFLSLIAVTAIEAVIPFFYKRFFDVLSASQPGTAAAGRLTWIAVQILGLWWLAWLAFRIIFFLNGFFQPRVMADIANSCFDYLQRHSLGFFLNRFVGSVVRRVNRFVDSFEGLADRILLDLFPMMLRTCIIIGVLWFWHPLLGIMLAVWLVIFIIVNYFFAAYKLKYDSAAAAADTEVTGQLADTVTNNVNIKIFTSLAEELTRFKALTEKQFRIRRFTWHLSASIEGVQGALMITLEFAIFYFAIRLWNQGLLTLGDFALLQGYLIQMFRRLWDFWRVIRDIYRRLADAEEMTEILMRPHDVQDKPQAKELDMGKGQVEFRDVSFTYTKTRKVITRFNLTVKPGEKVGLIGPSGAGKSTLVSLIFRFFDVQEGKILIDGQNIADVTQDSLRRALALVPQDPLLFHRTLMENIRYGRRSATDEEVKAAARDAHCDDFITRLPQGFETYVGERGIKLSGGERQRVAIARAILKNAPILVLDEATSSLDSHSEGLIQDAFSRLMQGKTTIVIAHRLSTIMKMDRIVVVRQGQVYEIGTHAELLQMPDGLYKKLWELQIGGFISG
ncbi:MAG: hypothetical protein A3J10_00720 [Candidatus Sungbacteria bacterium RIFCSPLOWO2_02_FULL_54_10]|uniref:ABC transporter ATP-binding protein n=2 Tax=Candidatus Sungiibacteriota TaxID=1817917 RepID=A0A1G2L7T3_9BACT|nr:MAG: hypothetical protein A2679_02960 [Candidatus Sungbacteria bacterium RIFCSPHIGHO2_01_FULL_54_26]OHA03108.1 MAG: hypothetical protein A3C92_02105 [Candidatus Sungbacteria bacterium RIFCSPHIGHO2_02_FULL_53_17]OHA07703.1 MAG: hypothetical protein A3B34_00485 [Candidatus Sungbacteria bacterium RIFCSPLOWO2_01_FULL_54_21]OHA12201.1 MAG: hypothetical protein A3J10_00720 [Candidatus Sungbacteria bacterium RIFCSPLOWO2_02_FULL_54_10]